MLAPAAKVNRLVLLDGLRGIAAILVVLYHCSTVRGEHGWVFGAGYLAVDFFFILSSFVLTLAFERKFEEGLGAFDFMKIRVIRLWPALTVGILLGALAHTLETPSFLIVPLILFSLIMYPITTKGGVLYNLNCVQWSLAAELIANLAHAAVLRRLSTSALIAICAISAVALGITIHAFGSVAVGGMADNFVYGLPRVAFSYTLGIVLARRWRGMPLHVTRGWIFVLAGPALVMIGVGLLPAPVRVLGEGAAVLLVLPLLFHAASRSRVPDPLLPWLHRLGAISYPLYAVHYPLLLIATWMNARLYPDTPEFVWNVIGVTASLAMAQLMASSGSWLLRLRKRKLAAQVRYPDMAEA